MCRRLLILNLVPSVWSPLTDGIGKSAKEREVRHRSVQNEGELSCEKCGKGKNVCVWSEKEGKGEKETLVEMWVWILPGQHPIQVLHLECV